MSLNYKFNFFFVLFLLIIFSNISAQKLDTGIFNNNKIILSKFVGFQVGYSLISLDSRIDSHFRYSTSYRISRNQEYYFDAVLEYYYASDNWPANVVGINNTPNLHSYSHNINAISVDIITYKKITHNSSVGFGIGVEYDHIIVSNNYTELSDINNIANSSNVTSYKLPSKNYFSPLFILSSELQIPINQQLKLSLNPKLKLTYIGKRYHAHPIDSWITFTISGGFLIKI